MTGLLDAVSLASASDDPEVSLFLATASPAVVEAAWITSVSLGVRIEDLNAVRRELWPESPTLEVSELDQYPIFQRADSLMELASYAIAPIADSFRTTDEDRYIRTHDMLLTIERTTRAEIDEGAEDEWFIAGRVAFYLAALNEDESANLFRDEFASPPNFLDQRRCRLWLTSLVVRQQPLLPSYARDLVFYRGYRLYVGNRRQLAREAFEEVISADQHDQLHAIALHLAAVLESNEDQRIQWLEESITLSHELGLRQNEVMARNTLVTTLFRRGDLDEGLYGERLNRAASLADYNRKVARETGDRGLVTWSSRTWSAMTWEAAKANHSQGAALASSLLDELAVIRDQAFEAGEVETAVHIVNTMAVIERDIGQSDLAIGLIEDVLPRLSNVLMPYRALRRLAQTLGSMRGEASLSQERIAYLSGQLDQLLSQ